MSFTPVPHFARAPAKPLIGVLCCNEVRERPIQAVASRFVEPLARVSGATVLLVPALPDLTDIHDLAERLDGLLLTGSRSNVAGHRYGGAGCSVERLDEDRDEMALALSARMIERARPVFGICRGLQELNVLFGGTLACEVAGHQRTGADASFEALFEHEHDVTLVAGGMLHAATGTTRLQVNSVHEQGIDRLGAGLAIEARSAGDDLVEAFSANPCGAPVVAVQWHPEWNYRERAQDAAFFALIGNALRGQLGSDAPASLANGSGDIHQWWPGACG